MSFSDAAVTARGSMSTLKDLEPGSPEYEAEIDRLQAIEDAERNDAVSGDVVEPPEEGDDKAGSSQHGDAPAVDAAPAANGGQPANAPASTPTDSAPDSSKPKVAGVATKDGKKVLPYSVLAAERRRASQLSEELEAARRQIESLSSGKPADQPAGREDGASSLSEELTDDDLSELAADFPQLSKLVGELRETRAVIAKARTTEGSAAEPTRADTKADQFDGESSGDPTLDAIEQIPVLAGWMTNPDHAELFERAQAIDKALETSPKWRDKPLVDRFKHVVKQVADEFDMTVDLGDDDSTSSQTQTHTPPARRDPDAAIRAAKETPPNTLSDFKGGAHPEQGDPIKRMSSTEQVNKLMTMTDAEIDAWLLRTGG